MDVSFLVYTGVLSEKQPDGTMHDVQQQCVAVGDGVNYEKCENNPVMTAKQLPSDSNRLILEIRRYGRQQTEAIAV